MDKGAIFEAGNNPAGLGNLGTTHQGFMAVGKITYSSLDALKPSIVAKSNSF